MLAEERRAALDAAIAALPERQRVPLVLRYHGEMSYDEIAERLDWTRQRVAVSLFRAKQSLRRRCSPGGRNHDLPLRGDLGRLRGRRVPAGGAAGARGASRGMSATCRGLVRALRDENRLLARVLDEIPEAEPSRPLASSAWAAAVAALVAVAFGLHVASDWLAGLGREAPAGLVDERRIVLGLLFEAVFYMLREGASMLESILATFVLPVLIVLGGLVALSLRRRWVGGTLALVASPRAARGRRRRSRAAARAASTTASWSGAGETVDDSLAAPATR